MRDYGQHSIIDSYPGIANIKETIMANYKKWNQSELDFIVNNQDKMNDDILALQLSQSGGQNVTRSMIRRQRRKLNIKKKRGRPRKTKPVETQTFV